jgi:hypothetical protein
MRTHLRRLVVVSTVSLGLAVFAGWAAAETITRGQAGADTTCDTPGDFIAVQTGVSGGTSYTVPAGEWTITSWTAAGGPPGAEALVVYRPTGTPDRYKIVGSTSAHALPGSENTFGASIKVKGGDLVGFWAEAETTRRQIPPASSSRAACRRPARR